MRIQGLAYVHGPQAINSPHRLHASQSTGDVSTSREVDRLEISHQADLVSRVRDVPEIRADRVAAIRSQIAAGVYETEEKINLALDRLLEEIG